MIKTSAIADRLYENASRYPDKEAIWCDGKSLTYREFSQFVSQCSNFLYYCGIKYGDHIAVSMNNSIDSVALFFSAADLGVCIVPFNPSLPTEAYRNAVSATDIKHVIASRVFFEKCSKKIGISVPGVSICLDSDFEGTIPFSRTREMDTTRPKAVVDITGDESLILTMTSGSTGNPKPIDISQKNKIDRSMAHIRFYGLSEADRILTTTPLYHSLAERLVILPLLLGATTILLPGFSVDSWIKCTEEQKPTFTIMVPAQLVQIIEVLKGTNVSSLDSFRCIVSSSALLDSSVKRELIDLLKCEFHEMYGTTEVSTVTDICFKDNTEKFDSVGMPFDNAQIRILRDDSESDFDTDCATREIGEIAVKTNLQCKGYYKQDLMMKAAMFGDYFRTGDMGYLDEDGYLYLVGRKKELIVSGAVNVYPNDIDVVIGCLPEVEECAAFAYPDAKLGEVVALAVVAKEDQEINVRAIKTYCSKNLADFQQPHKIFVVDKLPRNTLGKLQRLAIRDYVKSSGFDVVDQ